MSPATAHSHAVTACCVCSGIVLKDLVAIDIQAKDLVNPGQGLLNMNKYRNLWRIFVGIRNSQTTPPLLTPHLDRMRVLRVQPHRTPGVTRPHTHTLSFSRRRPSARATSLTKHLKNCRNLGSHGSEQVVQWAESHLGMICQSSPRGPEENSRSWTVSVSPSTSSRWWMYVPLCVCVCGGGGGGEGV